MRERERKINNATEAYSVSYKSPHHQRYSLEHSFQDQIESKAKADKVKQFSEHVRENFAPQIDEKKKDDLEKKIEE
jgi:predicted transcriptional regulator